MISPQKMVLSASGFLARFDTVLGNFMVLLLALLANTIVDAAGAQSSAGSDGSVAGVVTTNSGPKILFSETTHDFGRVESGKVVIFDFAFTNAGNGVLELTNVWSSCGCTTVGEMTKRVEPGKSGIIPVQFNSGGMSGAVHKSVVLACNDPIQSKVTLFFKAIVWKSVDALPSVVAFMYGPDTQTEQTKTIRLVSNIEEPITLSDPVCTNSSFRVGLKPVKEGKEFELSITAIPPFGVGGWTAPVTVKCSSPRMPVVTATAYVMVQPALTVNPLQILLPEAPLAEPVKAQVMIQTRGTNALVLSEPSVDVAGADIQLTEVKPGRAFQATVTFPKGFRADPEKRVQVRLKSNHPQSPQISIPVQHIQVTTDEEESASTGTASDSQPASKSESTPVKAQGVAAQK